MNGITYSMQYLFHMTLVMSWCENFVRHRSHSYMVKCMFGWMPFHTNLVIACPLDQVKTRRNWKNLYIYSFFWVWKLLPTTSCQELTVIGSAPWWKISKSRIPKLCRPIIWVWHELTSEIWSCDETFESTTTLGNILDVDSRVFHQNKCEWNWKILPTIMAIYGPPNL